MSIPELTPTLLAAGSGLSVLVVGAGLGTGARALWAEAAAFLPELTVIGIDLPGHGASPAAAAPFTVADLAAGVAATVATLRAGGDIAANATLFYAGVSLAGAVALQLGVDFPELFAGLGAVCTGATLGEPQAWQERARIVEVQGTPTQVIGSAGRWFAPGFIESHPSAAAGLLHTLQDADRFSYARCCEALAAYDLSTSLARITAPVLAIAGGRDTVCPPAMADVVAAGVVNGRAKVIANAAHQAPLEAPAETARLLADFFTTP